MATPNPNLIYRSDTNEPLSYDQLDGNFAYLSQSIANIVGTNQEPVTIGSLLTVNPVSQSTTIFGSVTVSGSNTFNNVGPMTSGVGCSATNDSFAHGFTTYATGTGSHTEGGYLVYNSSFGGWYSATAGGNATGMGSHAEGVGTQANGRNSHAEGAQTRADADSSHAEGGYLTASYNELTNQTIVELTPGGWTQGNGSHAEGANTRTLISGWYSHAEGNGTKTAGMYSHAEGTRTWAIGTGSHAEGLNTSASGDYSHPLPLL